MQQNKKQLDMKRVRELSTKIVKSCEGYTIEEIMTSLINIAGHVLAEMSEKAPVKIQKNLIGVTNAIKYAAFSKIAHENDKKKTLN